MLNDVVTTGTISPASPAVGQQFNLTNYSSTVVIPSSIASAAQALGNSSISGTAVTDVDATGASPASLSSGNLTFNAPLPSPIPVTGVALNLPSPAETIGPFTATGGAISLTVDPNISLALVVSGSTLNLECKPYPNNSAQTGIVASAPAGSPASPVIATATSETTSTTQGSSTSTPTSATSTPTTATTTTTPTTVLTGAYELYCPGTPVGNVVLNDAMTSATVSPAAPKPGQSFSVTGYQTVVNLPASLASAAGALQPDLTGSASTQIDASGATPAKTPEGPFNFDVTIPNPVPDAGVALSLPTTPSTISGFTATSGAITIQQDASASLSLIVAGNNLALVCTAYPNNSVTPSGITTDTPTAAPIAPVIAVAGGGSTATTGTTTVTPTTTSTPVATTTQPTTVGAATTTTTTSSAGTATTTTLGPGQEAAAPTTLSGNGQTATQPFSVAGGLAILSAKCSTCQGNFAVVIDDASGHTVDAPINAIGAYNGSVAEALPQGSYILNITADAAWTVTVTQPRNLVGATLPQTFSGSGQQAVGPFAATNGVRLQAQNTATNGGNFIVQVRGSDGSILGVPFNVIGNFNGSTISNNLTDGPYWLDVDSDGTWSITVSTVTSTPATTTTSPPTTTKMTMTAVTTATTRAVTTSASRSLAFTGEGPGLRTLTLLGGALMLLGLFSLVLADVPRRMVRQLAFFNPGRGKVTAAGGARTTEEQTDGPDLTAEEPVLDTGPREQLFIDVTDIATSGSVGQLSDSEASVEVLEVVAGDLAPSVDDAEAESRAPATNPETTNPETIDATVLDTGVLDAGVRDPELDASAVSVDEPEAPVATAVDVEEIEGVSGESRKGDEVRGLTIASIETADEIVTPEAGHRPQNDFDEIALESKREPEEACVPAIKSEVDAALPDAAGDIAPAGWYELSTGLRYWDGTNWTGHLAHRRYAPDGEATAHDEPLPWQAHGPELLGWWL